MSRKVESVSHLSNRSELYLANSNSDVKFLIYKLQDTFYTFQYQNNRIRQVASSKEGELAIGTILIAKVDHILPQMKGCFVSLNETEKGFLSLEKGNNGSEPINRKKDGKILEGDQIIVCVQKAASKNKPIQVTAHYEISSPYIVFQWGTGKIGYSAKLSQESKNHCREAVACWKNELTQQQLLALSHADLVVRTKAGQLDDNLLIQSIEESFSVFCKVDLFGHTRTVFDILSRPEPAYLQLIEDQNPEEKFEIITQQREIYESLLQHPYLGKCPVRLYVDDRISLAKVYALNTRLKELLSAKVSMKSGAALMIEQTEALVAIDVNSGKLTHKSDPDDYYLACNLEAADEIFYQIAVRNLSGMILIDFINMKKQSNIDQLIAHMKAAVKADKVITTYVDYTKLGLVELTRMKTSVPLKDKLSAWDFNL